MSSFIFNDFKERYLNGEVPSTDTWKAYLVNSKFKDNYDADKIKLEQFKTINEIKDFESDKKKFDDCLSTTIITTYDYTKTPIAYDGTTKEQNKPTFVTTENWNEFIAKFPQKNSSVVYDFMFKAHGDRCNGFYWVTTWSELCWCADRVNGVANGDRISSYNNKINIVLGDHIGTKNIMDVKCCIGKFEDRPYEGIFYGNGYAIRNFILHCDSVDNGIFGIIGKNGLINHFYVDGENKLKCDKKLTMSHIKNDGRDIHSALLCGKNYGYIEYARVKGKLDIEGFYPQCYAVQNRAEDATTPVGPNPDENIHWPAYMCIDNPGNIIPYCGYFNEGVYASKKIPNVHFTSVCGGNDLPDQSGTWVFSNNDPDESPITQAECARILFQNTYPGLDYPESGCLNIHAANAIAEKAAKGDIFYKIGDDKKPTTVALGDYYWKANISQNVLNQNWDYKNSRELFGGAPAAPWSGFADKYFYDATFCDEEHSVGQYPGTWSWLLIYDNKALETTVASVDHGDNSNFSTSALGIFNYQGTHPSNLPKDIEDRIAYGTITHNAYTTDGTFDYSQKEETGYNGSQGFWCDFCDKPMKMHQFSRQAYYCGGMAGYNRGAITYSNIELDVNFKKTFVGFFGGASGIWAGGTSDHVVSHIVCDDDYQRDTFVLSGDDVNNDLQAQIQFNTIAEWGNAAATKSVYSPLNKAAKQYSTSITQPLYNVPSSFDGFYKTDSYNYKTNAFVAEYKDNVAPFFGTAVAFCNLSGWSAESNKYTWNVEGLKTTDGEALLKSSVLDDICRYKLPTKVEDASFTKYTAETLKDDSTLGDCVLNNDIYIPASYEIKSVYHQTPILEFFSYLNNTNYDIFYDKDILVSSDGYSIVVNDVTFAVPCTVKQTYSTTLATPTYNWSANFELGLFHRNSSVSNNQVTAKNFVSQKDFWSILDDKNEKISQNKSTELYNYIKAMLIPKMHVGKVHLATNSTIQSKTQTNAKRILYGNNYVITALEDVVVYNPDLISINNGSITVTIHEVHFKMISNEARNGDTQGLTRIFNYNTWYDLNNETTIFFANNGSYLYDSNDLVTDKLGTFYNPINGRPPVVYYAIAQNTGVTSFQTPLYSIHNIGGFTGMLFYDNSSFINTSAYCNNRIQNFMRTKPDPNGSGSPWWDYDKTVVFDYNPLNRYAGFAAICDINSCAIPTIDNTKKDVNGYNDNGLVKFDKVYAKYVEQNIKCIDGSNSIGDLYGICTLELNKAEDGNSPVRPCSRWGNAAQFISEVKYTKNAIPSILSFNNSWDSVYRKGAPDGSQIWMASYTKERYTQYTHELAPNNNDFNIYNWTIDIVSDSPLKTNVRLADPSTEIMQCFNLSGVSVYKNASDNSDYYKMYYYPNMIDYNNRYTDVYGKYSVQYKKSEGLFMNSKVKDYYTYFGSSLAIDKRELTGPQGKAYYNDMRYGLFNQINAVSNGKTPTNQKLAFVEPSVSVDTYDDISDDIYDYSYSARNTYTMTSMDLPVYYEIDNQGKQGYWYADPLNGGLSGQDMAYYGNTLHIGHTLAPRMIRTYIDNFGITSTSAMSGEDLQGLYITDSKGNNVMYLDITVGDTVGTQSWSMELDRFNLSGNAGLLLEVE